MRSPRRPVPDPSESDPLGVSEGFPATSCTPCPSAAPTPTPEPPLILRAITVGIDAGIGSIGADIGSSLKTGAPLEAEDLLTDFAGGFLSGFLATLLISIGLNSTASSFLAALVSGFIFAEPGESGTDDGEQTAPCSCCPCLSCPQSGSAGQKKARSMPIGCPWRAAGQVPARSDKRTAILPA